MGNNKWNRFPKVGMDKFDGSNQLGWITQIERYFFLHDNDDKMKLRVGVLYLDIE